MIELHGSEPPEWFVDDGCTGVSDKIWGVDVSRACRLHDWHYHIAKSHWLGARAAGWPSMTRREADTYFYRNLYLLMVEGGVWKPYAMARAAGRMVGVCWFGWAPGFLRWVVVGATAAYLFVLFRVFFETLFYG